MKASSKCWKEFYRAENNRKPLIPESFVARIFLSTHPVSFLKSPSFSGKSVLDIGCGNGRHMQFLSQLGLTVSGVEVSAEQVETVSERFPACNVKQSLSKRLPFGDESFDIACGINAIYYLDDKFDSLGANLAEAARVIKRDGLMVVSFVGKDHFILKNAKRHEDESVTIRSDPLEFRNGTRLRPLWNPNQLEPILKESGLTLYQRGELKDSAAGTVRHLHYATAYKE